MPANQKLHSNFFGQCQLWKEKCPGKGLLLHSSSCYTKTSLTMKAFSCGAQHKINARQEKERLWGLSSCCPSCHKSVPSLSPFAFIGDPKELMHNLPFWWLTLRLPFASFLLFLARTVSSFLYLHSLICPAKGWTLVGNESWGPWQQRDQNVFTELC